MVWRDLVFCFVVCAFGLAFCAAAATLAGEWSTPDARRLARGSPAPSDAIVQNRPTWRPAGSDQSRR
ncbi:MAG TPA: hypothetical protein VIE63_02700 [Ramlibacter sp.]|jgi:hypothetical protein